MNDPIRYDEAPNPQWSDDAVSRFTVTALPSFQRPYLFDLAGTCPRCKDYMNAEHWLITFAGVAPVDRQEMLRTAEALTKQGLLPAPDRRHEFAVRCACEGGHQMPNGEAAAKGCGASWVFAVELA